MLTYGCGLTIPDEEEELCKEYMIPTWVAASLTNDLFSFQKEYEDAKKAGQPYVVNAVWVLMHEKNISEEEAKLECRKRIKIEIKKAIKNAESVKEMEVSEDLKRYLELLKYSLSGNVVWSLQCPRYHKNIPYNELQLQRAKYGIEKFPSQWHPEKQNGVLKEEILDPTVPNGVRHPNGVKTHVDSPKLNGTKKPADKDHSGQDHAIGKTYDLFFSTKLASLSDEVSVLNPIHLQSFNDLI